MCITYVRSWVWSVLIIVHNLYSVRGVLETYLEMILAVDHMCCITPATSQNSHFEKKKIFFFVLSSLSICVLGNYLTKIKIFTFVGSGYLMEVKNGGEGRAKMSLSLIYSLYSRSIPCVKVMKLTISLAQRT